MEGSANLCGSDSHRPPNPWGDNVSKPRTTEVQSFTKSLQQCLGSSTTFSCKTLQHKDRRHFDYSFFQFSQIHIPILCSHSFYLMKWSEDISIFELLIDSWFPLISDMQAWRAGSSWRFMLKMGQLALEGGKGRTGLAQTSLKSGGLEYKNYITSAKVWARTTWWVGGREVDTSHCSSSWCFNGKSHRCLGFFKSRQALSLELDWFSWNMVFPGYLLPDKQDKKAAVASKV